MGNLGGMRKVFGVSLFSSTLILAGCDLLGDGKELTELSEAADKEAPSIVSRNPDVDAIGVSVSTPLVIGFSEALDPDTVNSDNVKVMQGDTEITSIAISYNSSSRQIILTPDDDSLARNTQYRIELSADVRDVNGNPLRFTRDTFDNDGNIISELTDWGFVTETSASKASASLPAPVHGARVVLESKSGKVLIVGGRNTGAGSGDDFFNPTTAFLFDPGSDSTTDVSDSTWTESRQRGMTVTQLSIHADDDLDSNDIVMVGGIGEVPVEQTNSDTDGNLLYGTVYESAINLFDPDEEMWRSSASLATARAFHTTTKLFFDRDHDHNDGLLDDHDHGDAEEDDHVHDHDDAFIVIGGRGAIGELASIEVIERDGENMSSTVSEDLSQGRFYHTAVQSPDGDRNHVFVIGGCQVSSATVNLDDYRCDAVASDSVEILDTDDFTISSMSSELVTPRYLHTTVVLGDGRIMIAGGFDASGTALASIEFITLDSEDALQSTVATSSAVLPLARADFSATLLDDGRVLLAGGVTGTVGDPVGLDSLTIFDPATEQFDVVDRIDRILEQRSVDAVQLADGRVVISGGGYSVNSNTVITGNDTIYFYTP